MNVVRAGFAIVVVAAFAIFAYFLVENADTTNQTEWERWVYVFGAVEAIAFTAIGWVFGREVNRQRAESAEERANTAETAKTEEGQKGATLAGLVVGGAGGAQSRERLEAQGGSAGGLGSAVEYARTRYGIE